MKRESDRPKSCVVELAHHSYQPSREELREDHRVDATFDEIMEDCLRPAKIRYVDPRKRKR